MKYKIIGPLFLATALCFFLQNSVAQQPKTSPKKEVVIENKKTKGEKMTIVIDGDNVTINGKPITEYDGDNIIIRKKNLEGAFAPFAYAEPRIRVSPRIATPRAFTIPPSYNFSYDGDFFSEAKSRAQLGVVTEKGDKGVKITEVLAGSAADKAGLKEGDLITAVGGKKVEDPDELADIIEDKKPGDETEITYLRAKKSQKVSVKLGEQKRSVARSFNSTRPGSDQQFYFRDFDDYAPRIEAFPDIDINRGNFSFSRTPRMGIRIEDTEDSKGARILYVEEGSVAEKSGLKKDDVISSINGEVVKDTNDARKALAESHDKLNFPIIVQRGGSPVTIEVKIPKQLKKADL